MKIKNLLERLRPEVLDAMNAEKELYPNTVNSLENELKNNIFVSDIKYKYVIELESLAYNVKLNTKNCFELFENL